MRGEKARDEGNASTGLFYFLGESGHWADRDLPLLKS